MEATCWEIIQENNEVYSIKLAAKNLYLHGIENGAVVPFVYS